MSNHIIYTATEFEKMQFLKIQVSTTLQMYTYRYRSACLDENYQVQFQRPLLLAI